jgi:uncharacterized membrane protein
MKNSSGAILQKMRFTGIAAVLISYAVLVHHVNASGQESALGATLALAPLMLLGVVLTARAGSRIAGIVLLAALAFFAWSQWSAIQQHTGFVFWLQDMGLLLALLVTFGRTLFSGRKPLCVGFAEAIHGGTLPLSHRRYAHQITFAWTIFFAVMAIISTLLFFYASLAVWSVFVNFLILPLVALMFIVEYLVRRHMLPDAPVADIFAAVKAYRNMSLRRH